MGSGIQDNVNEFTSATHSYIESTINYHKLDIYKKMMRAAVSSIHKLIIGFIGLFAGLFLSVALSIYIGNLMDSIALGYLVVGTGYLVILLILAFTLKPVIEKKLLRKTSEQFFNVNENIKIKKYESLQ